MHQVSLVMPSISLLKLFLLALVFVSGICYSEIYKWVDERGKVHYSQTPPSKSAEKMDIDESATTDSSLVGQQKLQPSNAESQKKYSDYLEQERLERKEKREQKKLEKAEARSKCHSVRAQLDDMDQGGILYYELDENGERKFVGDKRIETRKDKLRKYLRKNCGGA